MVWRDMTTYPRCDCDGGWGAETLLRNDDASARGWQEAGYWLMTDQDDTRCCDDLPFEPTEWFDAGETWSCPALVKS